MNDPQRLAVAPVSTPVRRSIQSPTSGIVSWSAGEVIARLKSGSVSCREVLEAHLARIAEVNPDVNAICMLNTEAARQTAGRFDDSFARERSSLPALYGMPMVIKDNRDARGLKTTFGSPLFEHRVADVDSIEVAALRKAGAVIIGKANVPELSVGGRTHNPLFGSTRNPLDLSRTAGGSSGGNAAAIAAHMTPVGLGNDFGGSVRHPASFCGIYGLRPTPGTIAQASGVSLWDPFVVSGPLARNLDDLALLLTALEGENGDDPLSRPRGRLGDRYGAAERPLTRDEAGTVHVLWAGAAGLATEPAVLAACAEAMDRLANLGLRVDAVASPFGAAEQVYDVLRHWQFFQNLGPAIEAHPELVSEHIRWDVDAGARLTTAQLRWAYKEQNKIYRAMLALLQDGKTVVALPTAQLLPFDADVAEIKSIAGQPMRYYYSWQASCYVVTVTACPAISIPLPSDASGLSVGLQLVGPPQGEDLLIRLARTLQGE